MNMFSNKAIVRPCSITRSRVYLLPPTLLEKSQKMSRTENDENHTIQETDILCLHLKMTVELAMGNSQTCNGGKITARFLSHT